MTSCIFDIKSLEDAGLMLLEVFNVKLVLVQESSIIDSSLSVTKNTAK